MISHIISITRRPNEVHEVHEVLVDVGPDAQGVVVVVQAHGVEVVVEEDDDGVEVRT